MNDLTDLDLDQLTRASVNPQATLLALQNIVSAEETTEPVDILLRIYVGEKIIIPACNSQEKMPTDKELFPGHLSSSFEEWQDESESVETEVVVTKTQGYSKFGPVFYLLSTDLDKLCLSKKQIKKFVIKNRDKLHTSNQEIFFLHKKNGNYFVTIVILFSTEKLHVYDIPFVESCDRHTGLRIVVPAKAINKTLSLVH